MPELVGLGLESRLLACPLFGVRQLAAALSGRFEMQFFTISRDGATDTRLAVAPKNWLALPIAP